MTLDRSCSSPKACLWEALEVREKAKPKTLLAPAPLHRLHSLLTASLHSKPLRALIHVCGLEMPFLVGRVVEMQPSIRAPEGRGMQAGPEVLNSLK